MIKEITPLLQKHIYLGNKKAINVFLLTNLRKKANHLPPFIAFVPVFTREKSCGTWLFSFFCECSAMHMIHIMFVIEPLIRRKTHDFACS